MSDHIKQQQEEKRRLEEEIKQRRAILESANVDIITLNEFKKLKEELNAQGLSLKDPRMLLSVLKTIREIGYEPQKIVRELSRMKSLRQTERQLNNNRKDLEAQLDRYKDVLPLCEQILRAGIGFPELLAYHSTVVNKAAMDKLPREAAAYRVMEDIENYDKIGGLKNEISKMAMQQYTIGQIMAPREKAIAALLRLQILGVTDEEILNIYEWLNQDTRKTPYQQIAKML